MNIPEFWRDRCGSPNLDRWPVRCRLALAHDGEHLGWVREFEPIRWPGPGSPVPLCHGSTYRCWCPSNRP